MTEQLHGAIAVVGSGVEAFGVLIVVGGAILATGRFIFAGFWRESAYRTYRRDLGKAILLGLEFLIVGDIIGTVVLAPTLENVGVLGGIVLVRTFLSVALELEIEGRWPWEKAGEPHA